MPKKQPPKPKPLAWGSDKWEADQAERSIKSARPSTVAKPPKPAKRVSAGERIMSVDHGLVWLMASPLALKKARAIDRAIRAAVREAWNARGNYDDAIRNDSLGFDDLSVIPNRIEKKYGVKL